MSQLLLIVLIPFLLAFFYSYFLSKFSENRILLFMPAILGALWFLYLFTLYNPDNSPGLAGIAVMIYAFAVFGVMLGNIVASSFFILRKKREN